MEALTLLHIPSRLFHDVRPKHELPNHVSAFSRFPAEKTWRTKISNSPRSSPISSLYESAYASLPFPHTTHHISHPYNNHTNTSPLQDSTAALALVSARPNTSDKPLPVTEEDDADLARAKELLKLHYDVKEKHKRGDLARGLEEARREVGRVTGT
jgi:hypothetical protein